MKRFTVETVTITSTRFTGREYRAYFKSSDTDEEIEAYLRDDSTGLIAQMIQKKEGLGTRTTHAETTAYTRTIAPQEQLPCPRCDGSGWMEDPEENTFPCPTCNYPVTKTLIAPQEAPA